MRFILDIDTDTDTDMGTDTGTDTDNREAVLLTPPGYCELFLLGDV